MPSKSITVAETREGIMPTIKTSTAKAAATVMNFAFFIVPSEKGTLARWLMLRWQARPWQPGDIRLPRLHAHLRAQPARRLLASAKVARAKPREVKDEPRRHRRASLAEPG